MKRPLGLVLWLFLLLVQQKITVAIPLRNAADNAVRGEVGGVPDSPSISCPCNGLPEEFGGSPADAASFGGAGRLAQCLSN